MTETPQHPSEMDLKPDDVIRCVGAILSKSFTVGKTYRVNADGSIPDNSGLNFRPTLVRSYCKFIPVSRADERWFPVSGRSDWEYRINADGLPEGRPRKPVVKLMPAFRGLVHHNSERGYVTTTDGKPDWTTFSEKGDF